MPQGRGVWFPPAVRGKNPVPQAGAQTVAVRCLQPLLPCEGIALGCVNLAAHLGAGDLSALDEAFCATRCQSPCTCWTMCSMRQAIPTGGAAA